MAESIVKTPTINTAPATPGGEASQSHVEGQVEGQQLAKTTLKEAMKTA